MGLVPIPAADTRQGLERERTWLAIALASLLVLMWTTRGSPIGTPVADTYDFLSWLSFHRPLGILDAMGGSPYWRPVSRQLYYALLGPFMLRAPWLVALVHLALLAVLVMVLFRSARRVFSPAIAAALATFPVLGEPARALLAWPTGGEPLLAMVFAALAVQSALERRRLRTTLAATAAILSYEQALLLVPVLVVLVLGRRAGGGEGARPWLAPALLATGALVLGHLLAGRSGAGLLRGGWTPEPLATPLSVLAKAIACQLNVEDLGSPTRQLVWAGYAALLVTAVTLLARRDCRARVARHALLLAGGAAWFVAGMLIAGLGSPGWFPWRTALPALGLAVALIGLLGSLTPRLAVGFVAVRLVALLLAPAIPARVQGTLPLASSQHAFVRLARLQRVVDSARRAMWARYPSLPRGAAVKYWTLLEGTAWGFDQGRAVQVWYGDSTLTWSWFEHLTERHDAVLAFNPDSASPAVIIEPASLAAYAAARQAVDDGQLRLADSLFGAAGRNQVKPADAYRYDIANLQARVAHQLGDDARADSLNGFAWRLGGDSPAYFAMAANIALGRGWLDAAALQARRCLALAPGDSEAIDVLRRLREIARQTDARDAPARLARPAGR